MYIYMYVIERHAHIQYIHIDLYTSILSIFEHVYSTLSLIILMYKIAQESLKMLRESIKA